MRNTNKQRNKQTIHKQTRRVNKYLLIALIMLEALSEVPHFGRLLGSLSLSSRFMSITSWMFSPVCLSVKEEQKGVQRCSLKSLSTKCTVMAM